MDGIFEVLNTPAPRLTAELALSLAQTHFGIEATEVKDVGSERDQNFRLTSGKQQYIFKITNAAEDPKETDLQTQALLHVERVNPDFPIPKLVRSVSGAHHINVEGPDGQKHIVRVLTYLPGQLAQQALANGTPKLRRNMGAALAELGTSLRGFFHPLAGRVLLWDLQHTAKLRKLLPHIPEEQRDGVEKYLTHFEEKLVPLLPTLRSQVIQSDFNHQNVLIQDDGEELAGVIDFGDMVFAPLVCDIAIGLTYTLFSSKNLLADIQHFLSGYCSKTPLEYGEVAVLLDLVRARCMMTLLICFWRVSIHPYNAEYILEDTEHCWPLFTALTVLMEDKQALISLLTSCGLPAFGIKSEYTADSLLERRKQVLGPSYCLFYEKPVYIVRGEGIWLYDETGKKYLDCYNNVAQVGHCHPLVVSTLHQQARTLNTHTRYLHQHILDYSVQLTSTLPGDLSVCMFTCTGSESNDLALRIARAYTGHRAFMMSSNAYHGCSHLTSKVTPSVETGNEKGYAAFEPSKSKHSHVYPFRAPDVYARVPDSNDNRSDTEYFLASVSESLERMKQKSCSPAAVIIDPYFMSDGILDPPKGYLQGVASLVRSAGGLYIADEVQAGMGRTGTNMWGFQNHGLIPDIVTLGKPIGNGHPLGVVITTPTIAAAFAKNSQYFNTFGGNPVSCAVGLSVLKVLQEEKLQENSHFVGQYLREGMTALQKKYPCIASLRGQGLTLGIELKTPDGRPASELANKLVNRLRDDGILLSESGQNNNILKFRPPLVFNKENGKFFLETIDRGLHDLTQNK